jgi:DNA-directed RNA polymerase
MKNGNKKQSKTQEFDSKLLDIKDHLERDGLTQGELDSLVDQLSSLATEAIDELSDIFEEE